MVKLKRHKTTALITGCQRSGTTLLNLILDSHPDILGIDEMDYSLEAYQAHMRDNGSEPCISLKLPTLFYDINQIRRMPELTVLWSMRDPRDVVLSMLKPSLYADGKQLIPWVTHPSGSLQEIKQAISTLTLLAPLSNKSATFLPRFHKISLKSPSCWTHHEQVFIGALCWRLKHEVLNLYSKCDIPYQIVYYEQLVQQPTEILSRILPHLGLEWHNNLLKHHELHKGVSVGNTVNSRPIDAGNTGNWRKALGADSRSIITYVCGDIAGHYGYSLSEEAHLRRATW